MLQLEVFRAGHVLWCWDISQNSKCPEVLVATDSTELVKPQMFGQLELGLVTFLPQPLTQEPSETCGKNPAGSSNISIAMCKVAASFDLIIRLLDLVEGIITTVHFDERKRDIVFLALFWTLMNFVDVYVQDITERTKCRCRWGECLLKCGAAGGQCALYIHFCKRDAAVHQALIVLMIIQIVLKVLGTLRWHCGAPYSQEDLLVRPSFTDSTVAWQRGGVFETKLLQVLPHGGGGFDSVVSDRNVRQEVVVAHKKSNSDLCPCLPFFGDAVHIILFGCLPLLCQPNSPYRQKWNEVTLCVVLWWFSFRVYVLRLRDETEQVRFCATIRLFDLIYHIYATILAYFWGFSGEVVEDFDRGYTIFLMIIQFCFFCSCSYSNTRRSK